MLTISKGWHALQLHTRPHCYLEVSTINKFIYFRSQYQNCSLVDITKLLMALQE